MLAIHSSASSPGSLEGVVGTLQSHVKMHGPIGRFLTTTRDSCEQRECHTRARMNSGAGMNMLVAEGGAV